MSHFIFRRNTVKMYNKTVDANQVAKVSDLAYSYWLHDIALQIGETNVRFMIKAPNLAECYRTS